MIQTNMISFKQTHHIKMEITHTANHSQCELNKNSGVP